MSLAHTVCLTHMVFLFLFRSVIDDDFLATDYNDHDFGDYRFSDYPEIGEFKLRVSSHLYFLTTDNIAMKRYYDYFLLICRGKILEKNAVQAK